MVCRRMGFVWTTAYHNYKPCRQPSNHESQVALMLCRSEDWLFLIYRQAMPRASSASSLRDTRLDIIHTGEKKNRTVTPQRTSTYTHADNRMSAHTHTHPYISEQKEFLSGKLGQTVLAGENVCAQRANLTVWQPTKQTGRLACAL